MKEQAKGLVYLATVFSVAFGAVGIHTALTRGYIGEVAEDLVPFEEQFREECENETFGTFYDGSLDEIIEQRNGYLESQGVRTNCESWICSNLSGDLGFGMYIVNKRTCKSKEE
jgi:hypothetical protein